MAITSRYPLTRPSTSVNLNRKKILISGAKFSRSSVGTYVDENGLIKNAEYNEPRFNYDSETGEFLGLLVEEAKTNYCTGNFNGTGDGGEQNLPSGVTTPDGSTTAYLLNPGNLQMWFDGLNVANLGSSGEKVILSYYAYSVNNSVTLRPNLFSSPWTNIVENTIPGQWVRIYAIGNLSGNNLQYRIHPYNQSVYTQAEYDAGERVYLWGFQVEKGTYPTSYIPTSGSTVTREADTFELPIKTFKSGRIQYSSEIAGNSYYGNIALKDSINTPEYSLEIGSANSVPTISTKFSNVLQSTASLTKLPSTTTKAFSLSFNFDKDTGKIDFSTPVSDDADASVLELPSKSSRKLPSGYSIDTLQVLPGTNIKEVYLWNEELDVNKLSSLSEDFASINTQVVETEGYSANRSDYDDLPSLDLNFARNKSLDDNLSGDNLITFTRGSTATYVGADGLIKTAAIDTPRFDHDPDTLESLGLLIEEERTNLVTYSEQFDQSAWVKSKTSIIPNVTTAPDGTLTADKLVENSLSSTAYHILQSVSGGNNTYTNSVYVKQDESDRHFYIEVGNCRVGINLIDGSVFFGPNTFATGWSNPQVSVDDAGDGWYRVRLSGDADATVTTVNSKMHVATLTGGAGGIIYDGDGSSGVYLWGAQLEANASFATSYIPTTSSTVTRATDVASITGTNFSSWYNQSEGTVFAEYDGLKEYARVLNLNTGKTLITNRSRENQAYDGVTPTTSAIYTGLTLGDTRKSVTAYSGTTTTLTINGLVPNTGNSDFTSTTSDGVYLGGQGNNTNVLNGHISRLTYWPTRLPDTKLQEITSLTVDTFDLVFDSSLDTSGIISIITTGNCTYEVDWGDGSAVETIVASGTFSADHTYIFPSKYNAKINVISGVFRPYYNNSGKADQLVEIRQTPSGWTNTSTSGFGTNLPHAWRGANNLEFIDKGLNISGVNDLYNAWKDTRITSFPLLDTSSGTDFSNAWRGCSNLASFPLLNTSSGTIFVNAWRNCSSLTRFPKIDTSSANNVAYAWNDNANLVSFPQLDFSSVLNETGVYEGFSRSWWYCTNLENFPAGCFDNTAGTYFYQSFNFTKLNAESVSNILSSINNANTSDGVLGIFGNSASSPAGNYDWNSAGWDGFNGLISRNWTIDYVDNLFSSTNTPLDLQFAATKTLDSRITFTRGSTGTYVDSNGIIQTAAVDTPRFDHDPVTGESLGLLIEEARTNQFTYSDFGDISWTAINITKKSTNNPAPDGTNTAVLIGNATGSANTSFLRNIIDLTGGGVQTFTYYAKGTAAGQSAFIDYYDGGSNRARASISLDDGSVTYVGSPAGDAAITSTDAGNGWWRCQLTLTPTGTIVFEWRVGNTNSGDIYIWGAQLEAGSFPTSYIPTSGTTVTRAADVASITGTNFSSWFNQSEGTMFSSIRAKAPTGVYVAGAISDNTPNNRIYFGANTTFNLYVASGGSPQCQINYNPYIQGLNTKQAAGLAQNDMTWCSSGIIRGSDTTCLMPVNVDRFYLNANEVGAQIFSGHIARLTYWPKRLPDGALKYITQ